MNEKLKQFARDRDMCEAVRRKLHDSFSKKRQDRDVNILAAQQLAQEFLKEVFDEFNRLALPDEEEVKNGRQVGL